MHKIQFILFIIFYYFLDPFFEIFITLNTSQCYFITWTMEVHRIEQHSEVNVSLMADDHLVTFVSLRCITTWINVCIHMFVYHVSLVYSQLRRLGPTCKATCCVSQSSSHFNNSFSFFVLSCLSSFAMLLPI